MLTKHIPILLSSDPANGASNVTADGAEFDVDLDNENIQVPDHAVTCTLHVQDAEFFYTFPNITTGVNDLITITYDNGIDPLFTFDIVIPQGLYSITDLDDQLQVEQFNQPGYPEANPLIELIGSDAQQKVLIKYNFDGVRVDLTGSQTFRDLLGFDSSLYPVAGVSTANTFDTAQNVANFNTLKYVLLSCNLVDNGLRNNNTYDFYVIRILITAQVGQQQIVSPGIKMKLDAQNLIGKKLSRVHTKLVDQNGQDVNTNNETYSLNIVLEYQVHL